MNESAGAKRGPYATSLARREKISKVVLAIVDELGLDAVTTALVSRRAHIPEPSVLYHFPTKDHLLVAAMQRADDETANLAGVDSADIELDLDALRSLGGELEGFNENRKRLDSLVRSWAMNPEHPAAAFVAERNLHAVRVWSAMIAHRQREGLADPDLDPEAVAWQAIALLDGLTGFGLTHPELPVGGLLADGILSLTRAPSR